MPEYLNVPYDQWAPLMKLVDITDQTNTVYFLYRKRMFGFELKDSATFAYCGFVNKSTLINNYRVVDTTGSFCTWNWSSDQTMQLLKDQPHRKLGIEQLQFKRKYFTKHQDHV